MDITLITPCSENISAFGARSISAFLRANGHKTRVILLPVMPHLYRNTRGFLYAQKIRYSARMLDQVVGAARGTDIVGISFMTQYFSCAVQITEVLKQRLSVPVLWGGVHPTVRPEDSLKHADIVCVGEGEEAVLELLNRMQKGESYDDLSNLCLVRDGKLVKNPVRPLIQNLDTLPALDYGPDGHFVRSIRNDHLLPFDATLFEQSLAVVSYHKNEPLRSFMFFTTRGCPYKCAYCVNAFYQNLYGSKGFVRKMSVERVVDELSGIISKYPFIEEIEFCDDNFAVRSVEELDRFSALYKEKIGIPFQLLISPQNITAEKIDALVDAGLVFVETGIQSAAEVSEQMYRRKAVEETLLNAASILNSYRNRMAPPCYHLILDNPFESVEDTLKTFELTLKLPRPFWFKRSSLVAFPGTMINTRFREAGLVKNEEEEIFTKILEMPSTSYLNFLFLLNNQNYPIRLLRLLSKRRLVNVFNKPFWAPFLGMCENAIRLASRAAKLAKMIFRGDWRSICKRISMAGRSPTGMISSRPPS